MRLAVALGTMALMACVDSPSAPAPAPPPSPLPIIVSLSPNPGTVLLNDSLQVSVTYNSVGETEWTWISSNATVATVTSLGWVRGQATGHVAITACTKHQPGNCGSATVNVR